MAGKLKQLTEMVKKSLKLAFIALSHKAEYKYHFLIIQDLKRQIEAEKDEIIRLYDQMKQEYQEE